MNLNYGPLVGWGIVIYAVVALLWQALALYGFADSIFARLAILATLVVVTTIAARSLRCYRWVDVLPYSLSWAVVVALLDALLNVPYAGWLLFADWNVWLGYALVAAVPLITFRRESAITH